MSHEVKVNEAGVFVERMPESVGEMMFENLINGYAPKRVDAKIPILSFYALGKPKLSDAYTEEQKASFDQFFRNVRNPFYQVFNFRISKQISSCKNTSSDPRWASLLFHSPGGTGL